MKEVAYWISYAPRVVLWGFQFFRNIDRVTVVPIFGGTVSWYHARSSTGNAKTVEVFTCIRRTSADPTPSTYVHCPPVCCSIEMVITGLLSPCYSDVQREILRVLDWTFSGDRNLVDSCIQASEHLYDNRNPFRNWFQFYIGISRGKSDRFLKRLFSNNVPFLIKIDVGNSSTATPHSLPLVLLVPSGSRQFTRGESKGQDKRKERLARSGKPRLLLFVPPKLLLLQVWNRNTMLLLTLRHAHVIPWTNAHREGQLAYSDEFSGLIPRLWLPAKLQSFQWIFDSGDGRQRIVARSNTAISLTVSPPNMLIVQKFPGARTSRFHTAYSGGCLPCLALPPRLSIGRIVSIRPIENLI